MWDGKRLSQGLPGVQLWAIVTGMNPPNPKPSLDDDNLLRMQEAFLRERREGDAWPDSVLGVILAWIFWGGIAPALVFAVLHFLFR